MKGEGKGKENIEMNELWYESNLVCIQYLRGIKMPLVLLGCIYLRNVEDLRSPCSPQAPDLTNCRFLPADSYTALMLFMIIGK